MKCPHCDTLLVANARFCGVCGTPTPGQAKNALSDVASSDVTLLEPLSEVNQEQQTERGVPKSAPKAWSNGILQEQPRTFQAPSGESWPRQPGTVQVPSGGSWLQQPEAVQAPSGGFWQEPAPQTWTQQPETHDRSSKVKTVARPKRRRRIWWRVLLVVVIVLAGLVVGARFLIHNLVTSQLDQTLNDVQNKLSVIQNIQGILPPGAPPPISGQTLQVQESKINDFLQNQDTGPLKNLNLTVMPDSLRLDFQVFGFNCTVLALPVVSGGTLQVTNVDVQGIAWWVMSSDELTAILNPHLMTIGQQLKIRSIMLLTHEIDFQVD
jgi:hypothetical protein